MVMDIIVATTTHVATTVLVHTAQTAPATTHTSNKAISDTVIMEIVMYTVSTIPSMPAADIMGVDIKERQTNLSILNAKVVRSEPANLLDSKECSRSHCHVTCKDRGLLAFDAASEANCRWLPISHDCSS